MPSYYACLQQLRLILNRLTSLESRPTQTLSGTGTVDLRLIAYDSSYTWTFTDARVKVGDRIIVGTSTALVSNSFVFFAIQARCITDGEILLTYTNLTVGGVSSAAGTHTYSILKS